MRQAPKESIQSVVARAYTAAGGIDNVSADVGLAKSTLCEHTEMPNGKRAGGLGINYADTLSRVNPASAAVFAEHFASLAGGAFQAIASDAAPKPAWQHVAGMAKEFGEALAALSGVDHGMDRAEVRKELVEALLTVEAAIRDHDAGTVQHIGRRAG